MIKIILLLIVAFFIFLL